MLKGANHDKVFNTSNPFVPAPETYATNAVNMLGFTNTTTGWWSHGIMTLTGIFDKTGVLKMIYSNMKQRKEAKEALRAKEK